jgi:hypothetical protein
MESSSQAESDMRHPFSGPARKQEECRKTNRPYLKKEIDSLAVSFYGPVTFSHRE